jgi:hypothetical protein
MIADRPAGVKRLSNLLVTCWNRRDGVARELERRALSAERRAYLEQRFRTLCDEQDHLEVEMTKAARADAIRVEAAA